MERKETERVQFTENKIAHLPVPAKRRIVYDIQERDLGLKLEPPSQRSPNGSRTFFWFHSVAGKPKWVTIGPHPAMSLNDARMEASALTRKNNDWKKTNYTAPDPFALPAPPPVPKAAPTLRDLVEAYCEQYVPKNAQNPEKRAHEVRRDMKRRFGDWFDRPIDAITHRDVATRHAELGEKKKKGKIVIGGHASANRAVELLQCLYNWANGPSEFYHVDKNPASLSRKAGEKFNEDPRTRFLKPEEIVRLDAALASESQDVQDFIRLLLYTGVRKTELLTARWEMIDLGMGQWTIPKPRRKNKTAFVVNLDADALAILRARGRRMNVKHYQGWVFPGDAKEGCHGDFARPWKRVRKNAGLVTSNAELRVDLHSLRHTAVSITLMGGASLPEAAAVTGHRANEMVLRYGHFLPQAEQATVARAAAKRHALMEAARKQLPA